MLERASPEVDELNRTEWLLESPAALPVLVKVNLP